MGHGMLCRKSPSDGRERHRPPNLFIRNISSGCVFAEFPVPLEHPRVPHAAFNTPEQLIVRLARRMEGKHRKARIERVFRFALGGIVRITLAAAQSPLKSLIPAIKFSSVGAIGFTRCGACRAAARSSARCAKTFSVCGGVAFAFVG